MKVKYCNHPVRQLQIIDDNYYFPCPYIRCQKCHHVFSDKNILHAIHVVYGNHKKRDNK
jgi:hypothetical protein